MTRSVRRTALTIGVLIVALLPVTAAVSSEEVRQPDAPVAVTQPVGNIAQFLGRTAATPVLPESGLIMLVGSGLLGLGTIVRRSTRT